MNLISGYLASDIRMATPILFAGLGLLIINRSGLLNIGAEGTMLVSTLLAVVGSYYFGSVWAGLLCAVISGALMGLLFAFFTVTVKANQIVIGAALNILGSGLSATLNRIIFGVSTTVTRFDAFTNIKIPLLSDIPLIGGALFNQMIPVYAAFLLVPVISYYLFRTQAGLNLRSVGENPRVADTLGVNVYRLQYMAAIIGSALIAAGGAYLSTGLVSSFSEEMVAGRGYIALAAVVFGKYKPGGVMLASLIFVAGNVLSNILQVSGTPIPYTLLTMIPYVLTVVALAAFAKGAVAPASLGRPYKRG
ncbi:MAG TPA: ABC transporter permease [Clostridia bacterium]|nr:ABC transporter permease [Clostridia bacterium]